MVVCFWGNLWFHGDGSSIEWWAVLWELGGEDLDLLHWEYRFGNVLRYRSLNLFYCLVFSLVDLARWSDLHCMLRPRYRNLGLLVLLSIWILIFIGFGNCDRLTCKCDYSHQFMGINIVKFLNREHPLLEELWWGY
jgi:hypothetical protein